MASPRSKGARTSFAYKVPCPLCKAAVGARCVMVKDYKWRPKGSAMYVIHTKRYDLARKQGHEK